LNVQYLGDALDHWKGSLFEHLQNANLLTDFHVDPMASDADLWEDEDRRLFAHLLRIRPLQIVPHAASLSTNRQAYLAEIAHTGDLFLDPDTGIATRRVSNYDKYVTPHELLKLLDPARQRLVVVYQHVRAKTVRARVAEVLTAIQAHDSDFGCVVRVGHCRHALLFTRFRTHHSDCEILPESSGSSCSRPDQRLDSPAESLILHYHPAELLPGQYPAVL
jgi:hypothetical protein